MIVPIVMNYELFGFDSTNYFDTWHPSNFQVYVLSRQTDLVPSENFYSQNIMIPSQDTYKNLVRVFNIAGFWAEPDKKYSYKLQCGFHDEEDFAEEYTFSMSLYLDITRPSDVFVSFSGYSDVRMCQTAIRNLAQKIGLELFKEK